MLCAAAKTPVLTEDQARRLLGSVKAARKITLPDGEEAEEPWLVGLRDRALMAVNAVLLEPGEERAHGPVMGMRVFSFLDRGREKIEEPARRAIPGVGDHHRHDKRTEQGRRRDRRPRPRPPPARCVVRRSRRHRIGEFQPPHRTLPPDSRSV
jgi:hypothetical protein